MIIAIDFDGTLHDGDFPTIGQPLDGAVEYVNKLKEDNHYIIIWTCRNGDRLTEAINWIIEQNIPFDRINDHEPESKRKYQSDSRKVYAHLYVDDKQVGGLPSWSYIYKYANEMEAKYQKELAMSTRHNLDFTYNWNSKLRNRCFTTLRLRNDEKFYKGAKYMITLQGFPKGNAKAVDVKYLTIDRIGDWIARLDSGYSAKKCIAMLKEMYKKSTSYQLEYSAVVLLLDRMGKPRRDETFI